MQILWHGEQTPSSDVDIIVVFNEKAEVSLIGYIRIQYELENIFGRKVDLVEDGSLLPFAVESANRDKNWSMKGRVNDKAHLELILKAIDNVFEFTVNYDTFE